MLRTDAERANPWVEPLADRPVPVGLLAEPAWLKGQLLLVTFFVALVAFSL